MSNKSTWIILSLIILSITIGSITTIGNDINVARFLNVTDGVGIIIATYTDSYSCDASYCIYQPWYSQGNYYIKNMSNGKIEHNSISPSTVMENLRLAEMSDYSVSFAPGIYSGINLNLTTGNRNITYKSAGYKSAVLRASNTQTQPIINISCSSTFDCSNNVIQDFWIDINNNQNIQAVSIYVGRQNNIVHNYITNVYRNAIGVNATGTENPYETRIEKNTIDNPSDIITKNGTFGIFLGSNVNDAYVLENVVDHYFGENGGGIYMAGNSNIIKNNHLWGVYFGIFVSSGDGNFISENYLDSTTVEGIELIGGATKNIVALNKFFQNNQTTYANPNNNHAAMRINGSSDVSNIIGFNMLDNTGVTNTSYFINENGANNVIWGNVGRGTGGLSPQYSYTSDTVQHLEIPSHVPPTSIANINGSTLWNGTYLCIYSDSTTKKCAVFT